MILPHHHPARDGIAQIIWRLKMVYSLAPDVKAALGVAEQTERLITERASRSREMFAAMGYCYDRRA